MYHKEEIINGKLCWKGIPNGEWHEYSQEQLTERIEKMKLEIVRLKKENEYLEVQTHTEENHP